MEIFEGDTVTLAVKSTPIKNMADNPIYVNGIKVEYGETLVWDGHEYKITKTSVQEAK